MQFLVFAIFSLALVVFSIFGFDRSRAEITFSPVSITTLVPSPSPTLLPLKHKVFLEVPFVAQAPTGNWADPRQQDGCEEAAAWMAILWARGERAPADLKVQEAKIQVMADWQEEKYGSYHDTNADDTVERIYNEYFGYDNVRVVEDVTVQKIKQELSAGNLVQVPADGQILANPNYTAPGPERHNLIILGYDDATGEFITNDNGTRAGRGYRYKYEVMLSAIRDYPTGFHEPITEIKKTMIVVSK